MRDWSIGLPSLREQSVHKFHLAVHIELRIDPEDVCLHRLPGKEECLADLVIPLAGNEQVRHLPVLLRHAVALERDLTAQCFGRPRLPRQGGDLGDRKRDTPDRRESTRRNPGVA
jgi:hypothetical protein